MNALVILLFGVVAIAAGYFVYAMIINRRVIQPVEHKATPMRTFIDGLDFTPNNWNVMFA